MKELICPDCGGECKEFLNKHKCRSCLTEFPKRYSVSTIDMHRKIANDILKDSVDIPPEFVKIIIDNFYEII